MAVVERFRSEDRAAVDTLYRRVFGNDLADASRLRWDWQYQRNPNNPATGPEIWIAREGPAVIGQYATMPVRLRVLDHEIGASWGMDVMVAPERRRQGVGEVLFSTWDCHVGASLGLGLSEASAGLFRKLRWPNVGPVPCFVKPLSRRAFQRPAWPFPLNGVVSTVTLPLVKAVSRNRPLLEDVGPARSFDTGFTELWERVASGFDLAVRRDATYLNWKYVSPPHVRYSIAVLARDRGPEGYVVYRHVREPRRRVTILVDFLTHPDDELGMLTLLRFVDREAKAADSDKIRAFATHGGFQRLLRRSGYFRVKSSMQFVARVNALVVPDEFYLHRERWHVTQGDSDQDR